MAIWPEPLQRPVGLGNTRHAVGHTVCKYWDTPTMELPERKTAPELTAVAPPLGGADDEPS